MVTAVDTWDSYYDDDGATAMIYDATLQSPDAPGHAAPILPPAQPMITIISKLCCHSQQPLLLRPYYFAATAIAIVSFHMRLWFL